MTHHPVILVVLYAIGAFLAFIATSLYNESNNSLTVNAVRRLPKGARGEVFMLIIVLWPLRLLVTIYRFYVIHLPREIRKMCLDERPELTTDLTA
jgi:hypothetical protein